MALTSTSITRALNVTKVAGPFPFNGPAFQKFAIGFGNGVAAWSLGQASNLGLSGIAVGTAGGGTVSPPTTKILIPPAVPLLLEALSGSGISGPVALSLATTVALGISKVFTSEAQYFGVAAAVGAGQDISKITVANPVTLTGLLLSNLTGAFGGTGLHLPQLATGLARGISSQLLLGTGTGTVVGVASPTPASGPTYSVVI